MKVVTIKNKKFDNVLAIADKADMATYISIIEDYLGYEASESISLSNGINVVKLLSGLRKYVQVSIPEVISGFVFYDCEVALVEDGKKTVVNLLRLKSQASLLLIRD
jgi:hypothetical protein